MTHLLLSPLSAFLVACGLLLLARGRGAWLRVALGGIAGLALLLMTPLGANWLVGALERGVPVPDAACLATPPATIVVLGGGFDRPPAGPDDLEALSAASLRRVLGAVRQATQQPGGQLVISGGGPYAVPESVAMGALAQRLGVPAERLRLETRSMSTAENIDQLAAMRPPVDRRIWLVSSAMHLPRALATAQRAGFTACAVPVDPRHVPPSGWGYYVPQSSALDKSVAALHEWVGRLVYTYR